MWDRDAFQTSLRTPSVDPVERFASLFAAASALESEREANRAVLSTADSSGRPDARFVLLKHLDERGICIFGSYESRKGRSMRENPQASVAMHWWPLNTQVRAFGSIERLSEAESDSYFESRSRGSRLGAWASPQSQRIDRFESLEDRFAEAGARFEGAPVPRPEHWGGYRLNPLEIEFWFNEDARMHRRFVFTRPDSGAAWGLHFLAP